MVLYDKLMEFFEWLHREEIRDLQSSDSFNEEFNDLSLAYNFLIPKIKEKKHIKEEELVDVIYQNKLSKQIINLFQIITGISNMNFQTFFIQYLIRHNNAKLIVTQENNQDKPTLKIKINGKLLAIPKYDTLLEKISIDKLLALKCIEFFFEHNLSENLVILSSSSTFNDIIEIALLYKKKGSHAEKSGEEAERLVKIKFKDWGLIEGKDFNKNDIPIRDVIKRKLTVLKINQEEVNSITRELEQELTSRQFDLAFPLENPIIVGQFVYYTSNTGGIVSKKTDQRSNELRLLNKYIPNRSDVISYINFFDGVGWLLMSSQLRISISSSDDFFQINTTDSKLKLIINKNKILLPIDIEVAIYESGMFSNLSSIDLVIKLLQKDFDIELNKINTFITKYSVFPYNSISLKNNILEFKNTRIELVQLFYILKLMRKFGSSKVEHFNEYYVKTYFDKTYYISDVLLKEKLKSLFDSNKLLEKLVKLEQRGAIKIVKNGLG